MSDLKVGDEFMPHISIVMPAYNAQESIADSIQSVQNQSYADWELIVVDGGSTDSTLQVAQDLAALDTRIQVISTDLATPEHAREVGAESASSEYCIFCDSDDWMEAETLSKMMALIEENNLDLCLSSFCKDVYFGSEGKCVSEIYHAPQGVYVTKEEFREASPELFYAGLFESMNAAVYNTAKIRDLMHSFGSGKWTEHDLILSYLVDVERVGVVSYPLFHIQKLRNKQRTPQHQLEVLDLCKCDYVSLLALYESWNMIDNHTVYQRLHEVFLNELIACIEDICKPSCAIDIDHKHQLLELIVNAESTQRAVSIVSPKNRMQQMLVGPIKKKNVALLYSEARFISFIKHNNSSIVSNDDQA